MIAMQRSPLPNGGFVLRAAPQAASCWWSTGDSGPLPPAELLDCTTADLSIHHPEAERILGAVVDLAEAVGLDIDLATLDATIGPAMTAVSFLAGGEARRPDIRRFGAELPRRVGRPDVRFLECVEGGRVRVELPHRERAPVRFGPLAANPEVRAAAARMELPWLIGQDAAGNPLVVDLADDRSTHALVCGLPGAGKSMSLAGFLNSALTFRTPAQARLILIDCKQVELDRWHGIRHLAASPALYPAQAVRRLEWVKKELEYRWEHLRAAGKRDIAAYNADPRRPVQMPRIAVVVDELADLLNGECGKDVTEILATIARMGRAGGVHLVLCTQRPTADVVTTKIRGILPARLVFRVATKRDSTVCCDRPGAETLAGRGECFALFPGQADMVRGQGSFVPESDTVNLADYWRARQ